MTNRVTEAGLFRQTVIGRCRAGSEVSLGSLGEDDGLRLARIFSSILPWRDYGIAAGNLERYLLGVEPGAQRLGIGVGERVVGVAGLRFNWLRGPYLQFLAVEPDYQRRGLGGLVLAWMEAEAKARERANLWVMASQMEGSAISFYEAHGFKKECEISDLVVDGRDEILMRKRLNGRTG